MANSDFQTKLIEVIAAKVITQESMDDLALPEPFGVLRWTGWREMPNSIDKHGQIIWFMPRRENQNRRGFFVDIPSMNHGPIEIGETFSIDFIQGKSHYITEHTDIAEAREWFKEALMLLIEDVLNDCPWLLISPLEKR